MRPQLLRGQLDLQDLEGIEGEDETATRIHMLQVVFVFEVAKGRQGYHEPIVATLRALAYVADVRALPFILCG